LFEIIPLVLQGNQELTLIFIYIRGHWL
jgi:hypothetical protein